MTVSEDELNIDLWAAQWVLAAVFHALGLLKALLPADDLQGVLHLVTRAPAAILRPVGVVEGVASLLVVIPAATGVLPRLCPLAAGLLGGVSLLGALAPGTAGGLGEAWPNVLLAAIAAFVAWGRISAVPIVPLRLRDGESGHARDGAVREGPERGRDAAAENGLAVHPAGEGNELEPWVKTLRRSPRAWLPFGDPGGS